MSRFAMKYAVIYVLLEKILHQTIVTIVIIIELIERYKRRVGRCNEIIQNYSILDQILDQVKHMNRLVNLSDSDCPINLYMDHNLFARLCFLLRQVGGLSDSKYVRIEEQVAMLLSILGHHKKNMIFKFDFIPSGQIVSHYIHMVLKAILKIHQLLLVNSEPISANSTNPMWKWFKGYLGALGGIYIDIKIRSVHKGRYRTRKGHISTNVLSGCDRHMRFVYILPGWEGLAADARVLHDAVNRPNGFKVSKGSYYLCDNGYANIEGFLTLYKGVRYHLDEWGESSSRPWTYQELFNMRHSRARNVIEHASDILKMSYGIVWSASYYPIKIQNRLIMACFLIHNFIRNEMPNDPLEQRLDTQPIDNEEHEDIDDIIDTMESPKWNNWGDQFAQSMFSKWNHER